MPRCVPSVAVQLVQQRFWLRAKKPCFNQLWPTCSKRPAPLTTLYLNSEPPMTGCWLVFENQFNHTLPRLHEVVPSERASRVPLAV